MLPGSPIRPETPNQHLCFQGEAAKDRCKMLYVTEVLILRGIPTRSHKNFYVRFNQLLKLQIEILQL